MSAKKKDLATELIEDLLGDESSHPSAEPPQLSELDISKSSPDETIKIGVAPKSQKSLNFDVSVKTSVGRYAVRKGSSVQAGSEAQLLQVENLRVAQQKILDLEDELARLRQENEEVVAAAESLRKENEDLSSRNEQATHKLGGLKESIAEEKEILDQSSKAKDRELKELRIKVGEFEARLSSNLQKIRVRERELENRLELVKMESSALTRNKDEMLLDLKRQIDQLNHELENYRNKMQELNKKVQDKQELLRRTVKALRLAMSLLESEESQS